ncbi:MAG: hypothetical protein NW226_08465 [Microscillaceae bacterium]|nr:hypothetical protein [Microscillaceae bacterium]
MIYLPQSKRFIKQTILLWLFLHLAYLSFSQSDSTQNKRILDFKGAISITNNGFSVIPSFSLGGPAALAVLSIGGKKFSFEPELRFALEGKPWSFIFWGRYKMINTDKFSLNLGIHPALNFRTETNTAIVSTENVIVTRRFFAGEIAPKFQLSKNISISAYYLYSRGIDKYATRNTHFVAFRNHFSDIPLGKKLYVQFNPQIFYLKTGGKDGFYFTSTLTVAIRKFPLSISSIMNKAIQTDIVSKDFDWNLSLVYTFHKKYEKQ